MIRYSIKRVLLAILTLFIIIVFSYTLIITFGKNPYEVALGHVTDAKTKKIIEELSNQYKNQPRLLMLAQYLWRILQGNWGHFYLMSSIANNLDAKTIPQLFFKPLKWSIMVSLPAFIISALLGSMLGVLAGYKRGKLIDNIINIFVLIFIAIPSFIIAPFVINLFRGILPTEFKSPYGATDGWNDTILSILPAILVVTLGSLAVYTLYARNQVVTVLTSNYILIAKTKGLSNLEIFKKYVFRNISIPLAAIIIPSYIVLLSGSIIVEKFWGIPGSATIIAEAFPKGEIDVVMFNIIFFTALTLVTEIVVDITYALIDPRIQYEKSSGLNYLEIFKAYLSRKKEAKILLKQGGNN
ncbi:ABC transporter permease [Mycoplasmopsis lipofaciens]|uniref:ABC transporter permease n=1 Tax=Mycoplasmopsis lipofaciens TaxID=114884 RepID=UPI000483EA32|nr:ABC transporter permease [Mycoplasmopsis lipofaciens]